VNYYSLTPFPLNKALNNPPRKTDEERRCAYRDMVRELMKQDKINISNTCFIGDPEWVKKQYECLMAELRNLFVARELKKSLPANGPP
jgi:hypothetical protein